VNLVVRGAATQVENLRADQISVVVQAEGTLPAQEIGIPEVRLPEGISLVKVDPPQIRVTLE
jgi:hypothetical protein